MNAAAVRVDLHMHAVLGAPVRVLPVSTQLNHCLSPPSLLLHKIGDRPFCQPQR